MQTLNELITDLTQKSNTHTNVRNFVVDIIDQEGFNYILDKIEIYEEMDRIILRIKDVVLSKEYKYPPVSNE